MKNKLFLIAGGTGSGKSTFSEVLDKNCRKYGGTTFITMDNYYRTDWDNLPLEERMKKNFDHPSSIDWERLEKDLISLINGKDIKVKKYDFENYTHTDEIIEYKTNPIIMLEGIFALYDERVHDKADLKLFVHNDDDVRVLRRIKRDLLNSNSRKSEDLDVFISKWVNQIKPMHDEFIEPTKLNADLILPNSKEGVNKKSLKILESLIKGILSS